MRVSRQHVFTSARWLWGADEPISFRSLLAATPATWIALAIVTTVSLADFFVPPWNSGVDRLSFYLGASGARIARGEWWRLFTATLTNPPDPGRYSGWNHLVTNAVGLTLAGVRVEYALGRLRFAILFVLGGLSGYVAHFVAFPLTWGFPAGTSTSAYALYGAVVVLAYMQRNDSRAKRWYFLAAWIVLGVEFLGSVMRPAGTNVAHLGGIIVGLLMTVAWTRRAPIAGRRSLALAAVVLILCAAVVVPKSAEARKTDPRVVRVPIGSASELVTSAYGSLWTLGEGILTRIDPEVRREIARIKLGGKGGRGGGAMVPAGHSLWTAGDSSVVEIDPGTNSVKSRIRLPGVGPWGLSASRGVVWAALNTEDKVARIDLRTRDVKLTSVGDEPYTVLANDAGVWAANYNDRSISRIDPWTGRVVKTARVKFEPYWMEFNGSLLVGGGVAIASLDPKSLRVRKRVDLPDWFYAFTLDDNGHAWVSDRFNFSVREVDLRTGRVLDRVRIGLGGPAGMAFAGAVWATDPERRSILRIDTGV